MMNNPYVLSFGKIPHQYIRRDSIIDDIIELFNGIYQNEQAVKLTGLRGTGKTVTLTAIEKAFREEKDWIVVGIKSNADITINLVAELYSAVPMVSSFVDSELNLSAFGIGVSISQKSPVASIDYALKRILQEVQKKKKKVLITIDEARRTPAMIEFIQEFQILIREDLPIFLIAAGLYEDIESLENSEGLPFFLRAAKYEMNPLDQRVIKADYEKILEVSEEVAQEMANLTKGYAFAYQVLGKYMWDLKAKSITEEVLACFDETLSEKIYEKIWSELKSDDRMYMEYISRKSQMPVSELLELSKKNHSEWSKSRKRLSRKGLIDVKSRDVVIMRLPRFLEFIENAEME